MSDFLTPLTSWTIFWWSMPSLWAKKRCHLGFCPFFGDFNENWDSVISLEQPMSLQTIYQTIYQLVLTYTHKQSPKMFSYSTRKKNPHPSNSTDSSPEYSPQRNTNSQKFIRGRHQQLSLSFILEITQKNEKRRAWLGVALSSRIYEVQEHDPKHR